MGEDSKKINFQEKYKGLFEKLDQEPDKEKRWEMFSSDKVLYDKFAADYLREFCKLDSGRAYNAKDPGSGKLRLPIMRVPKNKEVKLDGLVFLGALQKAIRCYHLDNDTGASFYTYFSLVYQNEAINQGVPITLIDPFRQRRPRSDSYRKDDCTDTMRKLISAIKKFQERGIEKTAEQIIREYGKDFEQEGICKIFKKSLDASGNPELADVPLKVIADLDLKEKSLDAEPDYEEPKDDAAAKGFRRVEEELDDRKYEKLRRFLYEVAAAKAAAAKSSPKIQKQWEFYRAFLTRDIMEILKLEDRIKPFREYPAGDTEVYQVLEESIGPLWNQVCYKPYICSTIEEGPKDREYLIGQYYNMLSTSDITSLRMLSRIMNKTEQTLRNWQKDYSRWKEEWASETRSICREDLESERSF